MSDQNQINQALVQPQMAYQQPVQAPVYQQATQPAVTQSVYPAVPSSSFLGLDVRDTQFWKGALLGAAVTLLVTNESVQKGVVKTFSRLTLAAQSGIEEMKEKFEDAKAEAEMEAQAKAASPPPEPEDS